MFWLGVGGAAESVLSRNPWIAIPLTLTAVGAVIIFPLWAIFAMAKIHHVGEILPQAILLYVLWILLIVVSCIASSESDVGFTAFIKFLMFVLFIATIVWDFKMDARYNHDRVGPQRTYQNQQYPLCLSFLGTAVTLDNTTDLCRPDISPGISTIGKAKVIKCKNGEFVNVIAITDNGKGVFKLVGRDLWERYPIGPRVC